MKEIMFYHSCYMFMLFVLFSMFFVGFVLRHSASNTWSSQETQILEWMRLKKQPMDGMIIMFAPGKDDRDSNLS